MTKNDDNKQEQQYNNEDQDNHCYHDHHGNETMGMIRMATTMRREMGRDHDHTHTTPRQHSTTHHGPEPHSWGGKGSYSKGDNGTTTR